MTQRPFSASRILLIVGLAGAWAAPYRGLTAQAVDSTGMPSLELLALEAGRASRRHAISAVAHAMPAHPLVDSASLAGCAALDSARAAAITAAFARGLEVPLLVQTASDDVAFELPSCPAQLDREAGPCLLLARVTAPLVGMRDGQWEGRLTVELRCRSAAAGCGEGNRTIAKEYLYPWSGRAWRLYQHAWSQRAR